MQPNLGKQVRLLILCLVIIAASSVIAYEVERDFGKVDVQLVRFVDPSGAVMTAKLYRPVVATAQNKLPGVLCIHGYQNDKETQDAFAIELSRRGFVALAIDLLGHGNSDGYFDRLGADKSWGGNGGYQFLKTLPFVDTNNLGVMGHSLGAMSSVAVATANPDVKAVNPQCGPDGTPALKNLLLTQARFEEFRGFRENSPRVEPLTTNATRLKNFGLTGSIQWDTTYGDFAQGTARRVALVDTVHPGVTHNPKAVAEAVDWMRQALKGGKTDSLWIPPYQQIYMWKEWMTLLALLTAIFSLLPLTNILLASPFFAEVAQPVPFRYVASKRSWWLLAIVNIIIAAVTYPLLTQLGRDGSGLHPITTRLPFLALAMGNGVAVWFLGNALIYLVLFTIWYRSASKKLGVTMYDMGVSFDEKRTVFNWSIIGKTVLLAAILFAWVYVLEGIAQWAFGIEFRFLWPFMRQFTPRRAVLFPIYLIPALAFFLLNGGIFMFGQNRPKECSTPARTQWVWWLKNCFAGLVGLIIIWAIQYVPYLWLGMGPGFENLGLPQFAQMWPLMVFVFVPEFAVLLFLTTWFFRRTGRVYLGALVASSLAVWFTVAGSLMVHGS